MATSRSALINNTKRLMKRRRLLIGGILVALLLGFILFTKHGLLMRLKLEAREQTIHQDIQAQEIHRDSLLKQIHILKADTLEIERLARQNYGMVKPGEEVYFVETK